jgi:hypothetical protein
VSRSQHIVVIITPFVVVPVCTLAIPAAVDILRITMQRLVVRSVKANTIMTKKRGKEREGKKKKERKNETNETHPYGESLLHDGEQARGLLWLRLLLHHDLAQDATN